ncbi:unnamed protein product [Gadus morhua 'NCC']
MFRSLHPGQSADVVPEWGSPGHPFERPLPRLQNPSMELIRATTSIALTPDGGREEEERRPGETPSLLIARRCRPPRRHGNNNNTRFQAASRPRRVNMCANLQRLPCAPLKTALRRGHRTGRPPTHTRKHQGQISCLEQDGSSCKSFSGEG